MSGIWRDASGHWCYVARGEGATRRTRPPVNPWRHAYVRAKHFRVAEENARRLRLTTNRYVDYLPDGTRWGERCHVVADVAAVVTYRIAQDNASWGCV